MPITLNDNVHGTCGHCGGPVTTPKVFASTVPPVPTCSKCGATMKRDFGPTLPMNPRPAARDTCDLDLHDRQHDDLDRGLRDSFQPRAYDHGAAEHRRDVLDAKRAGVR